MQHTHLEPIQPRGGTLTRRRRILISAALSGALVAGGLLADCRTPAAAATTDMMMRVSAVVPALPGTCLVETSALFGTTAARPTDAYTVDVRCSGTVPYNVGIGPVADALALPQGAGAGASQRGADPTQAAGTSGCHGPRVHETGGPAAAGAVAQPTTCISVTVRSLGGALDSNYATINY